MDSRIRSAQSSFTEPPQLQAIVHKVLIAEHLIRPNKGYPFSSTWHKM